MHASVSRKPEARPTTAAPPAFAGSFDLPTRQSGAIRRPAILNPRTVADCGEHALIARIRAAAHDCSVGRRRPGRRCRRDRAGTWRTGGLDDGCAGRGRALRSPVRATGCHRPSCACRQPERSCRDGRADPARRCSRWRFPPSLEIDAFDQIVDGLLALAARYGVALIGGNITHTTGPMVLDVTAMGTVHRRKILTRAGARAGDEVYVTGTLGDAAAGLLRLQAA